MDLKVWIDGVLRDVGNVTEKTTCEDLILALSNAASQPGLYVLVAPWRGNEITFAPYEKPLAIISKLGEDPKSFDLVLRRLSSQPVPPHPYQNQNFGTIPVVPLHQNKRIGEMQNKLAMQEQELEKNRIYLFKLDKEISMLEKSRGLSSANVDVGPAAELKQLSQIRWNDLLESHRIQNVNLQHEKGQLESSLTALFSRISEAKIQLNKQENRLYKLTEDLFDDFELLNNKREEILQHDRIENSKMKPAGLINGPRCGSATASDSPNSCSSTGAVNTSNTIKNADTKRPTPILVGSYNSRSNDGVMI